MSEVFWTFFVTSIIGLCFGITKMCHKSKCKEFQLGCIKVIRDVELEEKENEFELTHKNNNPIENI